MPAKLSARQKCVLDFIIDHISKYGYPPSIREIGTALGIKSLRGVTIHLDALERKGFIKRERTSRSIRVLKPTHNEISLSFVRLPLVGTIAAGAPVLAVENVEEEVPVPKAVLGNSDGTFLLRVKGHSMIGEHILPDDLVIIRPQDSAENGDLVAVLIGDEATVKRLRFEEGRPVLVPANPSYQPIHLDGSDVRLIGKVIGLLRNY